MNKIKQDVFDKYLEIKQDLVNNIPRIFLKQHTYTRKYRGNLLTDINIGFYSLDANYHIVQIFIRHKNEWVRDRMVFNNKNEYIHSDIQTTIRSDD